MELGMYSLIKILFIFQKICRHFYSRFELLKEVLLLMKNKIIELI